MAIEPRPPAPGPVNFNHLYGEAWTKARPVHIPTPSEVDYDPSLLPNEPIDNRPHHEVVGDLLTSKPIPEITPVFLGLRRVIVERRIDSAEAKLDKLSKEQEVVRFVGKAILGNDNNYMRSDKELRPATGDERHATKKLSRIIRHRRHTQALSHDRYLPFSPRVPDKEQRIANEADPHADRRETHHGLIDRPARSSWKEKVRVFRHNYRHGKLQGEIHHLDHKFTGVVGKPAKQAKSVAATRDRLILKHTAITQAQAAKRP